MLQRFIFEDAAVRGEIVHLGASFQQIVSQHSYPPLIRQLLGEMLAAVTLLSAIIKFNGRLTVQFQGHGKLKLLLAQCDNKFNIRGLAQWKQDLTQADLSEAFKEGVLVIMMDPASGGKRYQSIVEWQGHSIAQSIEGYFQNSEQLPTRIWLSVSENHAAGLLLQIMPETKSTVEKLTSKEGFSQFDRDWEHIIHLSETLTSKELLDLDNETLLRRLYSQENKVRLFSPTAVQFHCECTASRCENALLLLGHDEIEEELKGNQKIVVTCDFCSKEFIFDRVDVERLFKQKGGDSSSSSNIH